MDVRLGVICTDFLGWRSVRKTWEEHFGRYVRDVCFLPPERFYARLNTPGWRTVGKALAYRRAAQAAHAAGYRNVLVATFGEATLLPRRLGLRYALYGDAASRQLRRLYAGKELSTRMKLQESRIRRLVRDGHPFIAPSDWCAGGIKRELGAREDQVSVVPLPVDTDLFVREEPPRNPAPRVAFVGGEFYRKGGDLLEAVAQREEFRHWSFTFVTSREAEDHGNVRFLNGVEPQSERLLAVLREADFFALPTKADCSSIAGIEAMSMGMPVVLGAVGGAADLVVDGENGYQVREWSEEALASLLLACAGDPSDRERMGRNARVRAVRDHSIPNHIRGLLRAIEG